MRQTTRLLRWFVAAGLLIGSASLRGNEPEHSPRVIDYDARCFQAESSFLLDTTRAPASRSSRISYLVTCGPREAIPVLASVLEDSAEEVRRTAGQYLAVLGDARGLRAQQVCLSSSACTRDREIAARLLGANGNQESSPLIAQEISRILRSAAWKLGKWRLDPANETLLTAGTIALARLGRRNDWELILRVVETAPDRAIDQRLLEALGYVDDLRAKRLLWNAHKSMLRGPSCFTHGLGVRALLPLSRLGEEAAIEQLKQIIKGIGTPVNCSIRSGDPPVLCSDRVEAFDNLKPRDAVHFSDAVFEVAAQEPEALGTREAWIALGIMHPTGFGEKLFKLAMAKKPHWILVQRQTLHDVIMANDPTLNEKFWREYVVESIPAHTAQKELVAMGLQRLMFSGARYWMEWTGD